MNENLTTDKSSGRVPQALSWFAVSVPVAIAILVSFFSPNFRPSADPSSNDKNADSGATVYPMRNTPLGADFLQEYTGGYIFWSPERSRLYDPDYSQQIQHDPDLVEFEWPEASAFPMVYPPFYYAATGIFPALSNIGVNYLWSARIWLWLAGLAVSLSGWLVHRFYPPGRELIGPALVASILYIPLLHNFNLAQKGSLLLLILSATWVLLYRQQKLAAGMTFGLIAFKPHLGLTIGLAMLLKGQWRFCFGAVAVVALLTGSSYAFAPQLWHDYIGVVAGMGDYVENQGYLLEDSHSLWGAMQLSVGRFSSQLAKAFAVGLGIVVVLLLLRVARHSCETNSPAFAIQFAAMVIAMIMLSPHFYTYDLTVLALALLLIGSAISRPETSAPEDARSKDDEAVSRRRMVLALVGLFVLVGIFPKIALATGVQLSVPCLLGLLWLIGDSSLSSPKSNESLAGG